MKSTTIKPVNLSKVTRRHSNHWVALRPSGTVVATAKSLIGLAKKFKGDIPNDLIVHRALPPEVSFAPLTA